MFYVPNGYGMRQTLLIKMQSSIRIIRQIMVAGYLLIKITNANEYFVYVCNKISNEWMFRNILLVMAVGMETFIRENWLKA